MFPIDVLATAALFEAGRELDRFLASVRTRIALSDTELASWRKTILTDFHVWLLWEGFETPPTIH